MTRRLLTTAFLLAVLAACGMPEDGDWPEDELALEQLGASVGYAVPRDTPEADLPTVVLVDESDPVQPALIFISAGGGGSADPGGSVSSTQDPIPAKNRRDVGASRSK